MAHADDYWQSLVAELLALPQEIGEYLSALANTAALQGKAKGSMRATLFATRSLTRMTPQERIRAVYWHACLRHVNGQHVNNASVRVRFGIGEGNSAVASRLLKEAKPRNQSASSIPTWRQNSGAMCPGGPEVYLTAGRDAASKTPSDPKNIQTNQSLNKGLGT